LGIKKKAMILRNQYFGKLEKNRLKDLAEFVVRENFEHHSNNPFPENYTTDVNAVYDEELNLFENSEVYITRNQGGTITSAIRVLKWNYTDVLPLQKIFGIDPILAIDNPNVNDIYHIGRFAVSKNVRDINLFKRLLVCVAKPICEQKGNMAFAECDNKLLRILNLLGVKTMIIGDSINYLGSETIPIAMNYDGVKNFYDENKHLINHFLVEKPNTSHKELLDTQTDNRFIALSA
jgi:hypothetical protein